MDSSTSYVVKPSAFLSIIHLLYLTWIENGLLSIAGSNRVQLLHLQSFLWVVQMISRTIPAVQQPDNAKDMR